ncbi:efflux RND transporter periplasmic adaptor subunit [Bradyrhizobium sp. dw_78]|uniref:efflux RND transporter periplasmic adaptor subunit n=1 Tax=Bradyrhizobium sp. dw_78 TaxID=2719793 RepID=UPI001BD2EA81|nr:efflux RND transporter periplasmic adaptor subunit [Bradyrhizobium sp. dw_78]
MAKVEPQPPANDAHGQARKPQPPSLRLLWLVLAIVAVVLGFGAVGHWRTHAAAEQTQEAINSDEPMVRTAAAKVLADPIKVTLPGQTEGFDRASIFARATGYIAERRVDIGSHVKRGDLLARIASPDLDRQLDQAEAQLLQVTAAVAQAKAQVSLAEANLKLGNVTFARIDSLAQKGFETIQNRDNQQANMSSQQANVEAANAGVKVAEANVQAQQATVNRLKTLASFEEVCAPFDGVVSARNVDIGDLVNADNGGGTPMFSLVQDDVLRVAVNIPQTQAVGIRDGLSAKVTVFELPDRTFSGTVARNAGALQSASRTLPVQVDVPNPDHALKAGIFVNIEIEVPRAHPNIQIPAEALIFNQQGLHVAVAKDNQIHFKDVKIYRDLGDVVELESGLSGQDQVVLNPPTTIHEGQKIKVAPPSEGDGQKVASAGQPPAGQAADPGKAQGKQ